MKSNAQVFQQGPAYCLFGDGKLARHLAHYFQLLGIPLKRWSRRMASWQTEAQGCRTLLLAVSDRAIEPLAAEIRSQNEFAESRLIHFSGALSTDLAIGAHPLMTFSESLYPLSTYEQIPFVLEQESGLRFADLFPELKNPSATISRSQKALYHAWCVMGGNFSSFLWARLFETFSQDLGLDPTLAVPYLRQVADNILSEPDRARSAWTGPIVRGDHQTIENNLNALTPDPYREVYASFVKAHLNVKPPQPAKGNAT